MARRFDDGDEVITRDGKKGTVVDADTVANQYTRRHNYHIRYEDGRKGYYTIIDGTWEDGDSSLQTKCGTHEVNLLYSENKDEYICPFC